MVGRDGFEPSTIALKELTELLVTTRNQIIHFIYILFQYV